MSTPFTHYYNALRRTTQAGGGVTLGRRFPPPTPQRLLINFALYSIQGLPHARRPRVAKVVVRVPYICNNGSRPTICLSQPQPSSHHHLPVLGWRIVQVLRRLGDVSEQLGEFLGRFGKTFGSFLRSTGALGAWKNIEIRLVL
jgi:hypothetical protein